MAETDFFLKIDGIDGEAKANKVEKWIECESWSWGASNSGSHKSGGGGGAGKVNMQDFHFVTRFGIHSPKLMLACADGTHIPKGVLSCRKAGGKQEEYLKVVFENLMISSYQTGGSGSASVLPTDQCSFNFTKINIEYAEQGEKGNLLGKVAAGYDLKLNQKV